MGLICSGTGGACYNTYTNALFVNKKILVPTYQMPTYDSIALATWQELKPGYDIVGIDCSGVIPEFGAIHCISKEIGTNDPLWIVHQKLRNECESQNHRFEVEVRHSSGVEEVSYFL